MALGRLPHLSARVSVAGDLELQLGSALQKCRPLFTVVSIRKTTDTVIMILLITVMVIPARRANTCALKI